MMNRTYATILEILRSKTSLKMIIFKRNEGESTLYELFASGMSSTSQTAKQFSTMAFRLSPAIFLVCLLFLSSPAFGQSDTDTSSVDLPDEGEFVSLRSDSLLSGSVTQKTRILGADSLIVNDSLRFDQDRVQAFRIDDMTYRRGPDGDWVQLAQRGPIDRWTRTEMKMGAPTVTYNADGQVQHTSSPPQLVKAEYFSVAGRPVQDVDPEALRPVVQEVPKSQKYLDQYQTLGRLQLGVGLAGLAVAIGSFATYSEGDGVPSGVFIGAGISSTSWIFHFARQPKLNQAIEAYNREKRSGPGRSPSSPGEKEYR